ncbi:pyridoxamine 5'-phosphate oxidase family protein [Gammaproteobacteria bacterium]|nr:pyridoxamine 5'-phosphate oxidase family protein [Gammaproteobacteria bacterium]
MVNIEKILNVGPYKKFLDLYSEALNRNQKYIEAVNVSSYSLVKNQVDSRYVNLKIVDKDKFIFFSNYESAKAIQFNEHSQVAVSIFWDSIYSQIRMKGKISKTSEKFNKIYFSQRDKEKNALAISSSQSKKIDSYESVIKNYKKTLNEVNLDNCPDYWGGYAFQANYFEFWEGHESRINKREVFDKIDGIWKQSVLEP